jgi:hypothetical protein
MYEARMKYKQQRNASMAQAVKVFINSLYGKFGEKHHDVQFVASKYQMDDEDTFKRLISHHIKNSPHVDMNVVNDEQRLFDTIKINNAPLIDLNERDTDLFQVNI